MTIAVDELIELAVEKPAAGGAMIARSDGRVVLVTGAIPGERVRARIDRVSKSVVFAHTVGVEEASADRRDGFVDPLCGGCVYGHIAYPRQLEIKAQVIADAFARIGRLPLAAPVPVAPSIEEGYRMRARLHVRGARIGFFREGTHDVCDPRASRQLLPQTADAIDRLAGAVRSLGADTVREIELAENVDATERVVHLDATRLIERRALEAVTTVEGFTTGPYVTDRLTVDGHALTLRRHVRAFFQGNRYLLASLAAHVAGQIPAGSSVVDLYAGAGLFSVAAAIARGAAVVAVEGDRFAAEALRVNATSAGGGVTAVHGAVESFAAPAQKASVAIVDPPRTGMTPDALSRVAALRAERIVYVSCDPPTLARDARALVDAGYVIDRADAFDLFPNTPHVETVVVFARPR